MRTSGERIHLRKQGPGHPLSCTLLDRAYAQCRREIGYFRFDEGDADTIAPNVRRNAGARNVSRPEPQPEQPVAPTPESPVSPVSPAEPAVGPGDAPFVNR